MQPLWYGDRRDRVKWGALLLIAKRCHLPLIIQVAFNRDEGDRTLEFKSGHEKARIPDAVWNHFSDLRRIQRLGRSASPRIEVFDERFSEEEREEYRRTIVGKIRRTRGRKVVFLDPDTGIQSDTTARAGHVTPTDVASIWGVLDPGDVLALYQHASRSAGWVSRKTRLLREACDGAVVDAVRSPSIKDVAILWARKIDH